MFFNSLKNDFTFFTKISPVIDYKLKFSTCLLAYLTASEKIGDMTKFFLQLTLSNITVWSSRASKPVSSSKIFFRVILGRPTLLRSSGSRVVTWYMGSGLKAQNMTGIRAQRKGLRAQKNGIRDHKAFKPESGIVDKVSAHIISWPRYITYSCFRLAAVPVIRSLGCLTKTWYHILNLLIV